MIGKPGGAVLVTLAERKSRMSLIALATNKTALVVKDAVLTALRPVAKQVYTRHMITAGSLRSIADIAKELEAMDSLLTPITH